MPPYEYKIVAAPTKGLKGKGVRGPEARFAHALEELMNGMAADGWEFQRAETLPSVERSGITGSTTEWRNVLVFRRPRTGDASAFQPELLAAPEVTADASDGQREDLPPSDPVEEDSDPDAPVGSSPGILSRVRTLGWTAPEKDAELSADNLKNDPESKG